MSDIVVSRGQYDQLTALFALVDGEIEILEAGGCPMRVTDDEYKRITVLASNFDQNHSLCKTCGALLRLPRRYGTAQRVIQTEQNAWDSGEAWCPEEKVWVYRTLTGAEQEAKRRWPKGSILGNFERGTQTAPQASSR